MARKERRDWSGNSGIDKTRPTNGGSTRIIDPINRRVDNPVFENILNQLAGQSNGSKSQTNINNLLNDSSILSQFLGNLGANGAANSDFLQLLLAIASGNLNQAGTIDDDLQQKLIEMFLANKVTQEQRDYDKSALDEQRIYDSPLNQLNRLMATGMSRNAAMQMLSAQSGETPLVGSGAGAAGDMSMPSPTESVTGAIGTAINFVGAVGSLVGLGFSIPQSIMQTQMLKNANWLTESQINAYKSTGQAFSILQKAGAATTAFSSAANAASALKDLANAGNQDAATFIANGGVDSMLANASFSSQTLGNLARSETSYKDYRKQFDLARKHDRLVNQLTQMDIDNTAAQTRLALQQALESDARIKEIYQKIQLGDIEIEIAGERLRMTEADADIASANRDILIGGLEQRDDITGQTGYQLASHDMFVQFLSSCEESAAKIEDRDAWHEYLKNNVQLARDLALIQAICSETYKMNITDENGGQPTFMNQLLRIRGLLRDSGLGDDIKFVGSAAVDLVQAYIKRKAH